MKPLNSFQKSLSLSVIIPVGVHFIAVPGYRLDATMFQVVNKNVGALFKLSSAPC